MAWKTDDSSALGIDNNRIAPGLVVLLQPWRRLVLRQLGPGCHALENDGEGKTRLGAASRDYSSSVNGSNVSPRERMAPSQGESTKRFTPPSQKTTTTRDRPSAETSAQGQPL